jgi:hypothetical protein
MLDPCVYALGRDVVDVEKENKDDRVAICWRFSPTWRKLFLLSRFD